MGWGCTNFALLAAVGVGLTLASSATVVHAQEREHAYVLEIGPAGEWPLGDHSNFGGTFAIESTPHRKLAGIGIGLNDAINVRALRMVRRFAIQKTLSHFPRVRIHGWRGSVHRKDAQWAGQGYGC